MTSRSWHWTFYATWETCPSCLPYINQVLWPRSWCWWVGCHINDKCFMLSVTTAWSLVLQEVSVNQFFIVFEAVFPYSCPDYQSSPAHLNSIGLATWVIRMAITKYRLTFICHTFSEEKSLSLARKIWFLTLLSVFWVACHRFVLLTIYSQNALVDLHENV